MLRSPDHINLVSTEKSEGAHRDSLQSAELAELIYVTDVMPGIRRVKNGKTFSYIYKNKKITNKKELIRIKKLVIPPAWKNVWICLLDNGHLQATGFDVKNRKQYKYHSQWSLVRNQTKYAGLY